MPTRKIIFWLLAAASFYLIALNVGSGWLYVLTAATVAVPLASPALSRLNVRRIGLGQRSPGSSKQGNGLHAAVEVNNPSRLPRFFLGLEGVFGGSRSSLLIPFLRSRGRQEVRMKFENLVRGVYPGGEFSLVSSAPLGLAKNRRRFTTTCPLTVYPRWQQLPCDWDTGHRNAGYLVQSAISTRNIASDYLGVRDYRPEDSPRSIHWRTSARAGRLAVVEYARQASITPVVIVDTFAQANVGEGQASTFEAAVSIATSLVQREVNHNRRFGLGSSVPDAAETGLSGQPGPAMIWLAAVNADSEKPLDLEWGTLPWSDATPVLILTSHRAYANAVDSRFFSVFPHSLVIMLDGRAFTSQTGKQTALMDDAGLQSLGDGIETRGGRFLLIPDSEDVWRYLAKL